MPENDCYKVGGKFGSGAFLIFFSRVKRINKERKRGKTEAKIGKAHAGNICT